MNPENNNPFSNTGMGATGASAGTPPLDLTSSSLGGTSSNGLSMADSIASAQDSLTAAGLASPSTSNVMGLDQIGATNPSAMMTPPTEEPLVPAAPVPGSIGSVTSMPLNQPASSPMSTTSPMSTAPSSTDQPAGTSMNAAGSMFTQASQNNTMPAVGAATDTVSQSQSTAPYNPFAKTASPAQPTTQAAPANNAAPSFAAPKATTPGAFQPANVAKKVSMKDKFGGGQFKNPLVLILAGLSAVLAVALVIFIVLYIGALNSKEYIYVPNPSTSENNTRNDTLTCTRQIAGEEIGKAGAVWGDMEVIANYSNGNMTTISSTNRVTFDSPDAANIARNEYEASLVERAATNGGSLDGEVLVDGAVVTMNVRATNETAGMILSGKVIETTNDEGEVVTGIQVDTNLDAVQAEFTSQGFSCNIAAQE